MVAKNFLIELRLPGNKAIINFPAEHIKSIRSHRSISAGSGGISFLIPYRETYPVRINSEDISPIRTDKMDTQGFKELPFREIFLPRTLVFLFIDLADGITTDSDFLQLNVGKVSRTERSYSADGKAFVNVTIEPAESIISKAQYFLDYQRKEGEPPERSTDTFVGVIQKAANFFKGDLKSLITGIWDELIYGLLTIPRFSNTEFVTRTGSEEGLTFIPPEKSFTSNFAYEAQIISSFSIGHYISLWDILKSYANPPVYELFCDALETKQIGENFGFGILSGDLGGSPGSKYSIGKRSVKVIFRPLPLYMFNVQGEWRNLSDERIDAFYEFPLEELIEYKIEESEEDIICGVHIALNVYQNFGTVLSEPKYNEKIRSVFGTKLLHVKLAGLTFKEENLTAENKEKYKTELAKIRDDLFSIFCNEAQLKVGKGSLRRLFMPIRVGMPFRIVLKKDKTYPLRNEDVSEFGYITDVIDEFSPGEGKAHSTVHFKWAPIDSISIFKD
ncbi:hypothetical protein K0V43_15135 [Leptospira sp. id769339]|nr:hypothetical protein [Leptospira sp. id769339]